MGNAKPYFYGAGRILGRVSRLYGYSMLLSGISSLFLTGFSSLPITKWDDKEKGGIPRAHNELVSVLLILWMAVAVSFPSRLVRDDSSWCLAKSQRGKTNGRKLTTCKILSPPQLDRNHSFARATSRQQTRS